ncbi:5,6-dimethylbenzimidazole synthase [Aliiroseovarius sp. xm-m-379]|uniref:5,6-dimethylbenzimidazole synthase n=1 Tax=unclassified Aliiroseovarius TaxID=2623558 RepID=UPI001569F5E7|nr:MULTISPECIES: 5,6-dimethylbenzimidazole synthase [unclassified Aliiroseovarius]NRP14258.1 5,6-dimethylbenzimidazole synthase [Aliiroseovarius sp. xm-d-517]NRP23742.1 5,6-dimethylbenzimidazole synthase [Aliiroseovarius sp. xm-m-379]NRP29011.1 5,6-dimethylbenzimidazole synthase [Aliiroseovarius sp. xm-m-314]NRP32541.1 5,6-dimethylbenzimidazole synthase [Aliiroseovarius sp. xm-a-104]NRP41074.1 5,6-dimethylbenzimidazole synthase [Aliiroseovarius sp. xm-m-339-2]
MHAFSDAFQSDLETLMRWRRDVRRFRSDPVDEALLQDCLDTFLLAPSVGLSEPWRVVRVESACARKAALENFQVANKAALAGYSGEKAKTYAGLKLSGMRDAPVQLAVFCDEDTAKGSGLGAGTMPEMRRYSVVSAIMLFWLATRARGLGLGWVSILDPEQICRDLNVPDTYKLVGYFCLGWPEVVTDSPELEEQGWEVRRGHLPLEVR